MDHNKENKGDKNNNSDACGATEWEQFKSQTRQLANKDKVDLKIPNPVIISPDSIDKKNFAMRDSDPCRLNEGYPRDQEGGYNHSDSAYLAVGESDGMDYKQRKAFQKGQIAIDKTLDLHGITIDESYNVVGSLIESCYHNDKRMLLIITGRGDERLESRSMVSEFETPRSLRNELPKILNSQRLRPLILLYQYAQPKDGGDGAYYVYLKRRRN